VAAEQANEDALGSGAGVAGGAGVAAAGGSGGLDEAGAVGGSAAVGDVLLGDEGELGVHGLGLVLGVVRAL
jgi:hypothetical protein